MVTCAVTNPSGQLLLTGSLDNTLKVWKLKSRELAYTFKEGECVFKKREESNAIDIVSTKEASCRPTYIPK